MEVIYDDVAIKISEHLSDKEKLTLTMTSKNMDLSYKSVNR